MKKFIKQTLFWWILAAIAVSLAIPKIIAQFGEEDSGNGFDPRSAALTVGYHKVEPEVLTETLRTSGTLLASEEVALTAETSGRVVSIHFDEGTLVEKNSLLVKINDASLQADLARLKNQAVLAELREARLKQLLAENATSQDNYEIALTELRVIEAQIQGLEADIAKTEIRAPFNGVIGLRQVSVGTYLQSNAQVATIRQLDPLNLEFTVPERLADNIRELKTVQFRLQNSQNPKSAEIFAIEPGVERSTRSIRVRARVPNPDYRFFAGSFARVEYAIQENENALLVPTIAVIPGAQQSALFVYQDGKVERRVVQTGLRTAEKVEILKGIEAGDIIITTGIQQLRDGQSVQLRDE